MFLLKKDDKFVSLVKTFAEAQVFVETKKADSITNVDSLDDLAQALNQSDKYESDVDWKEVILDVWDSVAEEFDYLAGTLISETSTKKDALFSDLQKVLEKTKHGFVSILDQLRDSLVKDDSDCCNKSNCCHKKEE